MVRFPVDAPRGRVVAASRFLGFRLVREREHVAVTRDSADGTTTPRTRPNHRSIKGSTLRRIRTQAGISREDFLDAFVQAR